VVTLPPPKPKPPPYSLPYGLRPAIAPQIVRIESSIALQDKGAFTAPFMLTATYKVTPDVAFLVRDALIVNDPATGQGGTAIVNPLLGMLYTPELAKGVRLPLFWGATIPIGMGGGDSTLPATGTYGAAGAGVYGRSALDNALMAVNFAVLTGGVGVAYVDRGLTVQAEGTVLQLVRVRGGPPLETDKDRTNLTAGLHVGYSLLGGYLIPSVEARAQVWATTPAAVRKDATKREQITYGVGVRSKLQITSGLLARPGLSYFRPRDDPMLAAGYHIVTLDVPFVF
jgi:hypothetical protein